MKTRSMCALLLLLSLPGVAHAAASSAEVDFENVGNVQTAEFVQDIAGVRAFDTNAQAGTVNIVQGVGLGVLGGDSDTLLDSTESLTLGFPVGVDAIALSITYTVKIANNGDGDGLSGETTVYGSGPGGALLGSVSISGTGTKNISAMFAQPLTRVLLVPRDGDSIQLEDFGIVAYGPAYSLDFSDEPTQQVSQIEQNGILVTAFDTGGQPTDVNTVNGFGLGVEGGPSDTLVDSGESVRFGFDGIAGGAWYQVLETGNGDGDGLSGEVVVYAWGANSHLLGSVQLSGTGTFDVSSAFGGEPIKFFSILAHDQDWVRVRMVTFACPGPLETPGGCVGDLDGDGDTDVFDFGIFAPNFACGTGP
jgi:hypothetical protein